MPPECLVLGYWIHRSTTINNQNKFITFQKKIGSAINDNLKQFKLYSREPTVYQCQVQTSYWYYQNPELL